MVIAAIGTVLAAGYLLWMFQRVAFGKVKRGVRARSTCTTCTARSGSRGPRCCSLIVVLGFYPNLVFKLTDPAVTHLVNGMSKVI